MKELINSLEQYGVLTKQNNELIKARQLLSINKGGFGFQW
jgi:hypothetical protein